MLTRRISDAPAKARDETIEEKALTSSMQTPDLNANAPATANGSLLGTTGAPTSSFSNPKPYIPPTFPNNEKDCFARSKTPEASTSSKPLFSFTSLPQQDGGSTSIIFGSGFASASNKVV